jgi:hypothetical protein
MSYIEDPRDRDESGNEHIQTLRVARVKAVQQRRQMATELAGDDNRAKTEEMQKRFMELHALIAAIDYAIEDEATDTTVHRHVG